MRHSITLTLIYLSICLCGVSCGEKKEKSSEFPPVVTKTVSDSAGYEIDGHSKVYAKISIESPTGLDDLSMKNFSMWLSTVVERERSTDADAVSSLAKAFTATTAVNLKNKYDSMDKISKKKVNEMYVRVSVTKIYEDDDYVTYLFEEEEERGEGHPSRKSIGYTFNRIDFSLAELIKAGDEEKYGKAIAEELGNTLVSDPEKLMDVLLIDDKYKEKNIVPLPANGAYLVGDSLVFKYQEYEITSYNFGMPCVRIPIKD